MLIVALFIFMVLIFKFLIVFLNRLLHVAHAVAYEYAEEAAGYGVKEYLHVTVLNSLR